jgi:hypothetical protein
MLKTMSGANRQNGDFWLEVYHVVLGTPFSRSSGIMGLEGFFGLVFESKGLASKYSEIRT